MILPVLWRHPYGGDPSRSSVEPRRQRPNAAVPSQQVPDDIVEGRAPGAMVRLSRDAEIELSLCLEQIRLLFANGAGIQPHARLLKAVVVGHGVPREDGRRGYSTCPACPPPAVKRNPLVRNSPAAHSG